MRCLLLALAAVGTLTGCVTRHSYRPLPDRYSDLPRPPFQESYFVEVIPAFSEAFGKRYEFDEVDGALTVQIQEFRMSGPKPAIRKSGRDAQRIRAAFRQFDWNKIENPVVGDDVIVLTPDDSEIVLKARTPRFYRELKVGYSDCDGLQSLLREVDL